MGDGPRGAVASASLGPEAPVRRWLLLTALGVALTLTLLVAGASPWLLGVAVAVEVGAGLMHYRAQRAAHRGWSTGREALARVVVEEAVDAILTFDDSGVVTSFNPAAERMFGWPASEILGQKVAGLFAAGPAPGATDVVTAGGAPLAEGRRDATAVRRDGTVFPAYVTCRAAHGDLQVSTVVARDMSEYRETAEALGLTNALLETRVSQLEERTRVITLLGRMSDHLQRGGTPSEANAAIADYGRLLFPHGAGALCARLPSGDVVRAVASWGEPASRGEFGSGDCLALCRGRAQASRADDTGARCRHILAQAGRAHVCAPVSAYGERFGVVCLDWADGAADPDAAVTDPFRSAVAVAFAHQIGIAIARRQLVEMLRAQAIRDPLTGLHNRRFLEEAFQRELLRAARRNSSVGVLMLDLDHFKEFNDAHGHAVGDELLCAFARQLKAAVRAEDVACRHGGEEFALILPDTSLEQAGERAEQIRTGLRSLVLEHDGQTVPAATVSIGVAASPEHGVSPDALLRAADAALYRAKAAGRDRTEIAQ